MSGSMGYLAVDRGAMRSESADMARPDELELGSHAGGWAALSVQLGP